MTKKKRGPQSQLAAGMYALNQRRIQVWIPFLEDKVKALQVRLEQKQDTGSERQGAK
jgi:hypothetical protein